MNREEMRELLIGPFATVPTAFDENYRVDYGRMYELTEWWIEMGLVNGKSVLKVAAAMGEGPQLRDSEWPTLLHTVVRAAKGRVPVMGAISYKDTVRAIEDAKMAKDVGATVKKIVADHLGVDEAKVTDEASFIDDLGADSLDTVELVMAFEEEFGSEISDSEAEKILTVGDAIKFIESHSN